MIQRHIIRKHVPLSALQICIVIAAFLISAAIPALADVTLPSLLADHMVIQRGLPVHVWGMAAPQEAVSVSFRGETKSATADDLGRWNIFLSPGEAGGPFQLIIKATNTITLADILVGDVWVASGQSNMEFPMTELRNARTEIAAAQYPKIRLFLVKHKPADYPLENVESKGWAACAPETVADFSAVAYFFAQRSAEGGRAHRADRGLVGRNRGRVVDQSAYSRRRSALMPVFSARAKMVDEQSTNVLRQQREDVEFQKAVAQAKAEGKALPWPQWHPDFAAWAPSALYNGMIAPLTPFAIRGVIWYQGEANASPDRASLYARLFQTMIRDWRNSWGEGDFPFLFVQIANWNTEPGELWPEVRNAQRQALALRNTGMAVTIDIGDPDDIHPKNKQDVGLRLSLAARAIAYGEKIEWSGPLYRQITREEHALRVWFDHADGLMAKGATVTGFELAGTDGKYSAADARIEGTSVVVSSAAVPTPVSVRYGWAPNPNCNLFNKEGLPASPFQAPE